jgi:uncharacterized protein (DUF433 family)
MASLNPRITVEPGKMGGKPCIRGLRFTVYDLASYLASGMTEDEILKDFPYLEKEDFQAVYEFFASIPEAGVVLKPPVSAEGLKTDTEHDPKGAEEFVALIRALRKEGSRPVCPHGSEAIATTGLGRSAGLSSA